LGAKGIGEIGVVGVAAAIGNAVFHATGVRVRELPITLDKVMFRSSVEEPVIDMGFKVA
jgi:xanthine dehydrogenase YagR molybdenum-binding subunit